MKKLFISVIILGLANLAHANDFAPFPLSITPPNNLPPAETQPTITPGVEYVLNPCAYVYPQEGYICVPTGTGGFVIVPAGGEVASPEDLFSFKANGSTGLVVDEENLEGIPPHLWPYVREMIHTDIGARNVLMKNIQAYSAEKRSASNDMCVLPDNTSCNCVEVKCTELTPGQYDCTCP